MPKTCDATSACSHLCVRMKGSNAIAWAVAAAVAGGWTYYEQKQANGNFSKSAEKDWNGKVLDENPQTEEAKKTLKAMRKAKKDTQ